YTATARLMSLAERLAEKEGVTPQQVASRWAAQTPLGRVGRPEEFADVVVWLASERASYVTGVAIQVDGGIVKGLYWLASAITHFIVGASIALPAMESTALRGVLPRWAIPVTAGLFGAAPDLDTYAMLAFDIPRGSEFAHRGVFHSAVFLILLASAVAL